MLKCRSIVLRALALCGAFMLGHFIGSQRSGSNVGGALQNNIPSTSPPAVTIATPQTKKLHSEKGDTPTISESRIAEADSESIRASSFGQSIFLPGTYLLDPAFLQSAGIPPTKIEAVSAIYANSLSEILQAEADSAIIKPGSDGNPPVLEVQSIQSFAREAVDTMRKEIIAELGFVSGELLSNSLASAHHIKSSLDAVDRSVVIESIDLTTPEGAKRVDQIWESYTTDTGTLVRSTIGVHYLEERYGDAGARLIEMAREPSPSSFPPADQP